MKITALLLAHFRRDYFNGDGANMKCRQDNCVAEFHKFNSFGKHLRSVHYADSSEEHTDTGSAKNAANAKQHGDM